MSSRRSFLRTTAALAAFFGASTTRRARADDDDHPIDPPPTLKLETIHWDHTPMYGGPSNAVVAVPTDLQPGQRLPMIVLLPGGHSNMAGAMIGYWGWWSEYGLGDIDVALRRGSLTEKDFQKLVRPDELAQFNRWLSTTPYRGAVYVTPWVVGRQLEPAPHGHMVADFLRDVVARVRAEFPVLSSREATGLGGMSSGGMFALYSGSLCSDLFGTLVAEQPFTDELVPPLHETIVARKDPQRIRIVTSVDDHQKKTTTALSELLTKDGIAHDLVEYLGAHSVEFARGPGGLDALLFADRALRGENMDGTKPLPDHDGLEQPVIVHDVRRVPPLEVGARSTSSTISTIAWAGAAVVGTAGAVAWARRRRAVERRVASSRVEVDARAPGTREKIEAPEVPIAIDVDDELPS